MFSAQMSRCYMASGALPENRIWTALVRASGCVRAAAYYNCKCNKQAFEFEPVLLREVVAEAHNAVSERLEETRCAFNVEETDGDAAVVGDREALVTVLVNLLDNSIKYSGDDKRIGVRTSRQGATVRIEVSDNGIGMGRRAAHRAFERFYQADRALSRTAGGCGLGLSIVKFIVDAHGGTVSVASTPGQGSTFTVTLPAANNGAAERHGP